MNQIECDLCVHELTAMQLRERVKALEAALRAVREVLHPGGMGRNYNATPIDIINAALRGEEKP